MHSPDSVPGASSTPQKWHLLDQQVQIQSPIFTAWKKRYRHAGDGREGDFFTFDCPDWVQAVALTSEGQLILVEQFRFGTEGFDWELSGGVMDAGDGADPAETARRELLEETGYAAQTARSLGWAHPNPALQGNRIHYVLLEGCTFVAPPCPDANEELRTRLATWDEVMALLDAGQISHALSVGGLYAYERYLRKQSGSAWA